MNMYQCPECYTEFAQGTKFCQNCGYKLQMEVISPMCPECGKTFPTGTKFCSEDGSELIASEMLTPCCEKCGKEYTDDTKFCIECGGKIVSIFCPKNDSKLVPRCEKCGREYTDGTKFCPEDGGQVLVKEGKGGFIKQLIDLLESWITKSDEFSEKFNEKEKEKAFKTSTFFSIGVLISFFLPWVDYVFTRLSAFKIPMVLDSLANFSQLFGKEMAYVKATYLLYLIPCFAIYNIISDLTKKENRWDVSEFWAGTTATAILLILALVNGGNLSVFGIGFYLTAIFSILGIVFRDR